MHNLIEKVENKTAKIGVFGQGYVGLPLAMGFCEAGYEVIGFEVDASKVKSLNAGQSHIQDVQSQEVQKYVAAKKYKASNDFSLIKTLDCVSICVPTPLNKTKDPDVSFILSAKDEIQKNIHSGMAIILESTTYPGTTEEIFMPMIKQSGLKLGEEIFLAFSPERIDPGNPTYHLKNTPKVVGGVTPACTHLVSKLYGAVVEKVVEVSSPRAAEMVKILENTYRAVNIGLVNEVAIMSRILGINTWEVIDAAATKPFGFTPFYPGPGLGGHCIPVDPHYLSWKLKTLNYQARFINLAAEINTHMPEYVVNLLVEALNERGKALKSAKILVLGMAYKANIADVRESPSLDMVMLLKSKGAEVMINDPYATQVRLGEEVVESTALTPELIKAQDAVVLATNHKQYNIKQLIEQSKLLIDTRNATKGFEAENIVRL